MDAPWSGVRKKIQVPLLNWVIQRIFGECNNEETQAQMVWQSSEVIDWMGWYKQVPIELWNDWQWQYDTISLKIFHVVIDMRGYWHSYAINTKMTLCPSLWAISLSFVDFQLLVLTRSTSCSHSSIFRWSSTPLRSFSVSVWPAMGSSANDNCEKNVVDYS